MNEELNELQRRMLSRQQKHYTHCATLSNLRLIAVVLVMGIIFAFVWKQTIPPDFATDAKYVAFYIGLD